MTEGLDFEKYVDNFYFMELPAWSALKHKVEEHENGRSNDNHNVDY